MKKFTLKMNVTKKEVKEKFDLPYEKELVVETEDGKSFKLSYGANLNEPTPKEIKKDTKEAFGLMIEEGLECIEFKGDPEGFDQFFGTEEYHVDPNKALKEVCAMKSELNKLGFTDTDIKQLSKQYPYKSIPKKLKKSRME